MADNVLSDPVAVTKNEVDAEHVDAEHHCQKQLGLSSSKYHPFGEKLNMCILFEPDYIHFVFNIWIWVVQEFGGF